MNPVIFWFYSHTIISKWLFCVYMGYFSASFRLCCSVKFRSLSPIAVFCCRKFNFCSWSFAPSVVFYCCQTGSNSFSTLVSLFIHSFVGEYPYYLCDFMFMFVQCEFMKVRTLNKFFSAWKKFVIFYNPYFIGPALCYSSKLAFS